MVIAILAVASNAKAFQLSDLNLLGNQTNNSQNLNSNPENTDPIHKSDLDSTNNSGNGTSEENKELRVPKPVSDPKEIEDAAEFASSATGVRKDFLMGMLVVESNLGRNPGKCTYQQVQDGAEEAHKKGKLGSTAWQTFQKRRDVMKKIAKNLGYNYEQLTVSCNPGAAYVGTGGAMGIPQFMPDVWMAYKDRIAKIVGKDEPDPWSIKDGVVAMALLVSDTPGVAQHSSSAERNAAKMYLSGSISSQYDWYANQIFYWAQNYPKLLV